MRGRIHRALVVAVSGAGCALAGCADEPGSEPEPPPPDPDQTAPRVVATSPMQGASGVYPAPLDADTAPRVQISLRFDEPMDPETSSIALVSAGGVTEPAAAAAWSLDQTQLTLTYAGSPLAGRRPLADDTSYALDLRGLRDRAGNALDPGAPLDQGTLRFTTGAYDPLLNHSCGHVLFGPYATAQAAPTRSSIAARTDTAHTRYTVSLPAAGDAHAGYTRLRATSTATWHLFLDGEVAVALESQLGEPLPISLAATPAACAGITHRATFHATELDQLFLRFGPQPAPEVKLVVELEADANAWSARTDRE